MRENAAAPAVAVSAKARPLRLPLEAAETRIAAAAGKSGSSKLEPALRVLDSTA
jgi:hypothetical protein